MATDLLLTNKFTQPRHRVERTSRCLRECFKVLFQR